MYISSSVVLRDELTFFYMYRVRSSHTGKSNSQKPKSRKSWGEDAGAHKEPCRYGTTGPEANISSAFKSTFWYRKVLTILM